jgi:hypothetical protein
MFYTNTLDQFHYHPLSREIVCVAKKHWLSFSPTVFFVAVFLVGFLLVAIKSSFLREFHNNLIIVCFNKA